MPYLSLNGVHIPVRTIEPTHIGIADSRGYGPNGQYQFQRNRNARAWRVRSSLLDSKERLSLVAMLEHRGDHWPFGVRAANRPIAAGSVAAEFYSNKYAPGYDIAGLGNDPVANVVSCFAKDGALVYWGTDGGTPIAERPWVGATGALLVEPGSQNLLTANNADPTANGHMTNTGAGTHAADTARYWRGTGSIAVNTTATAGNGVETSSVAVANNTTYVASAYYRGHAGSENVRLRISETGGSAPGATQAQIVLPTNTDSWVRLYVARTTAATAGTLRVLCTNHDNFDIDFSLAGIMLEQQDSGLPTTWLAGGAPGASRAAGNLEYANLLVPMTRGITMNCWARHVRLSDASEHYLFDSRATTNDKIRLYFTNSQAPTFRVEALEAGTLSIYSASGAALADSNWHMWTGVFDPTVPRIDIYKDGVLLASDTTATLNRVFNPSSLDTDFHIGNIGNAATAFGPGPICHSSVLPWAASADYVAGLYNSGTGFGGGLPGVMPMVAHGSLLSLGESYVNVFGKLDSAPHIMWEKEGVWQESGGEVAFTLFEDVAR